MLDSAREGVQRRAEAAELRPLIMEVVESFERGGARITTVVDSSCSQCARK